MEVDKVVEKVLEILEREGGEASLDRLVYTSYLLKEVGRERLLEILKNDNRVKVYVKYFGVMDSIEKRHGTIYVSLNGEKKFKEV